MRNDSRRQPDYRGPGVTAPGWSDAPRRAASAWFDLLSKATAVSLTGGQRVIATNERLAAGLADIALDGLKGQPIDVTIGDQKLRAVVDSVRLSRTGISVQARIALREVDWGGLALTTMSITANSVRIEPPAPGRLRASEIRFAGQTNLEALVAWLDERLPDWAMAVDHDGHVNADWKHRGLKAVIEPIISQHNLHARLLAVRCLGLRVGLPGKFRPTRTLALPRLPLDLRLIEARPTDGIVEFTASVESLDEPIRSSALGSLPFARPR